VAPFSDSAYTIAWHDENGQTRSDWAVVENINNLAPNATVCPTEIRKNAFFRRQGIPGAGGSDVIGDFYSYKQMMTANQNLQTVLIFCYQYMIAKFDIDGFRIDTLRYIDNGFERIFANAIREYTSLIGKKNFFMFGEDTAGEENISEFIGRDTINSLTGDPIGIDAVVDYPLYNILPMVCKGLRSPSSLSELFQERKVIEKSVMSTHGDATNYFITFLDNHDQFQRFYSSDSKDPNRYNDQVTLALACLFGLQGIPCLYYGTEQGLSGHGSRLENVREAMWGMTNPFNTSSPFYQSIQKIGAMRNNYPALRYGRQYFRPLSGDGVNFGISTLSPGVISFSRILADVEMVVVANTSTTESVTVFCLIDSSINAVGDVFDVVYSNKSTFSPPEPVQSNGSILSIKVTLQPMEVQVLA
jgi:glycosidase